MGEFCSVNQVWRKHRKHMTLIKYRNPTKNREGREEGREGGRENRKHLSVLHIQILAQELNHSIPGSLTVGHTPCPQHL